MNEEQIRAANRYGLWSSSAIFAIGVGYAVVLAIGFARHGLSEPIGDPVLAVMEVITLFSSIPIVTLACAFYLRASPSKKPAGLAALSFSILCAGTTAGVHFIELTAARQIGESGIVWPSRVYAAELLAWDVFLGLALVFAAGTFGLQQRERLVRRGLMLCGMLCLAGAAGPVMGNMRVQFVGVLGYAVVLPVVAFLLARFYSRELS